MRCDLGNKYPRKAIVEITERVSFFSDRRVWSCLNNIALFPCQSLRMKLRLQFRLLPVNKFSCLTYLQTARRPLITFTRIRTIAITSRM